MDSSTRAILFDLVGVLLFRRADYMPDATVDAIDGLIGQVTDDHRFREEVLRAYSPSEAEFDRLLARIVGKYEPFLPLWELLPELRKHYRLGVINNGTYLTFPLFNARLGLESAFDLLFCSAREGVCKPDVRIFERACQQLSMTPEQCLFMDDSEVNIEAARRIGMQVILWRDAAAGFQTFRDWLKRKNILW